MEEERGMDTVQEKSSAQSMWMQAEQNALAEMKQWMTTESRPPLEEGQTLRADYQQFLPTGCPLTDEQRQILDDMERAARLRLHQLSDKDKKGSLDADCEIRISADGLTAWAFLFPPLGGGKEPDTARIHSALTKKKVVYGVEESALSNLVEQRAFLQLIPIAHGTPPIEGCNGEVIDRFPREREVRMRQVKDNEQADYKDLGWLHSVHAGDIICDVIPAVDPVPGRSVLGRKIDGTRVQKPVIPMGKNTALNEEGTALLAQIDGQVAFSNGRFSVEPLVTISGNVDASMGNLDVLGDIIVEGDVLEGFSIKATGNIVIKGIVVGATLVSGGSMSLKKGMNGNNHGSLVAKEDVFAKFLENCTAQSGGSIFVESLINCEVNCNDRIEITSGHGIIVGGTVVACNSIQAKAIGNSSNRRTNIVLGSTPQMLQEMADLTEETRDLGREIDSIEKNITYLEKSQQRQKLTSEYTTLLGQLRLKLSLLRMQQAKKVQALEKLRARQEDMSNCSLQSDVIYPGTQITFGSHSKTITTVTNMCNVFFGPDGITIGIK